MKINRQIITSAAAILSAASVLSAVMPAQAGPKATRFFCGDAGGTPATMVETSKPGAAVPVIRWTSNYFSESGYTPAVRCGIVSKKFQDAYTRNPQFMFTSSRLNGQPIICASNRRGGRCDLMLYTVKHGVQDPILTLLRLEGVRAGATGPLNESTAGPDPSARYLGVQDLIAKVTGASAQDVPPTTPEAPTTPGTQPVNDGSASSSQPLW